MRGIYKRVKSVFTTFCEIIKRIKICCVHIIYPQLRVNNFPFGTTVMRLVDRLSVDQIFTSSGEALLWGSDVYNKNSN